MKEKTLDRILMAGVFIMLVTSALLFASLNTDFLNELGYAFFGSLFICGVVMFAYATNKMWRLG